MSDFHFLKNTFTKKWVISAPRRAKKSDKQGDGGVLCPFCPQYNNEEELYRVGGVTGDQEWEVKVVANKYPFAPIHELIINTPDHMHSFVDFSPEHILKVLKVYQHRFNEHHSVGQVYIFHNHGERSGESIPHSHTQLVVIPEKVLLEVPRLETVIGDGIHGVDTNHFTLFCPKTSPWPDEVWIAPKRGNRLFGEVTDDELADLAMALSILVKIFTLRYGNNFPYNFYISPHNDWYVRVIPRLKIVGGFEMGTNVIVNTQLPSETAAFIKENFHKPDVQKILQEHQAEYHNMV